MLTRQVAISERVLTFLAALVLVVAGAGHWCGPQAETWIGRQVAGWRSAPVVGLTVGQTYQVIPTLDGYTFAPVSQSVTVALGGDTNVNFAATPVADTTPPVVNILTPVSGATLALDQVISWSASDNVGVVSCAVYLDGNLQATFPGIPGTGPSTYSWTWQLSGWTNGTHTIEVTATDAASNVGSASITVTVERSLASSTRYWFSKQLGNGVGMPNPSNWTGNNTGR